MLLLKTRLAPSGIHGLGLFAAEFLPRGRVVWKFHPAFDLELTAAEIERLPAEGRRFVETYAYVQPKSQLHILCGDDARFFNHSDTPNTASVALDDGGYADVALSDIEVGEELTCDYRTFDDRWATKIESVANTPSC